MQMNIKKSSFLLFVILIYAVSFAIGFLSGYFLNIDFYFKLLVMDVISTVIIYIFTVVFKNTSIYDPYWSVAPILLAIYAFINYNNFNVINCLYLSIIVFWGIRLTYNWATVCSGSDYEDWRYRHYRETLSRPLFEVVNFFGLQMIPTLVVYAALSPMFVLFQQANNYLALIGFVIMIFGILLEIFADKQMHQFLKETKTKTTCMKGLWNYSRHPNYLGEILVWVGTFVSAIVIAPQYWYIFIGMILMICLFLFISIPLAESRQLKRKNDYSEYKRTTSMLLLLPHKERKM